LHFSLSAWARRHSLRTANPPRRHPISRRPPPTTRFDFDDDQVEGDIQRPDGELITSIEQAKEKSLIEIRRNFVPEIVKMIEDL
jgi:hypothetical protein